MNELTLAAAAVIGGLVRELIRLVLFPFTARQRNADAAAQEADATMDTAKAFEILAAQIIKSGDRSDKLFDRVVAMGERQDAEREMYRQREKEREEQHKALLQTLEKSLIEAHEQIKDLNEHITNLQGIQDKLKTDYSLQERLVEEQGRSIKKLEESEKQAHRLVIAKDEKINALENRVKELEPLEHRVKELEAKLTEMKTQQQQLPAAIVMKEPVSELKELVDSLTEMKAEPVSPPPGESAPQAVESEVEHGTA